MKLCIITKVSVKSLYKEEHTQKSPCIILLLSEFRKMDYNLIMVMVYDILNRVYKT